MWSLADRFKTTPEYWYQSPAEHLWEGIAYLVVSGDPAGKRYLDSLFKVAPRECRAIKQLIAEANDGRRKK